MRPILIILSSLILAGCSTSNRTYDLQQIYGQKISMPTSSLCVIDNIQTEPLYESLPKIIILIEATGCTPCSMKSLHFWKSKIDQIKQAATKPFQVLVIVSTKYDENQHAAIIKHLNIPVVFDEKHSFENANILPTDPALHCLLLDQDNKVILVGSFLTSTKMLNRYVEKINN